MARGRRAPADPQPMDVVIPLAEGADPAVDDDDNEPRNPPDDASGADTGSGFIGPRYDYSADEEEMLQAMKLIGYEDDYDQEILLDEFGTLTSFRGYSHADIANIAKRGAKGNQTARTVRIPAAKELALKRLSDWVKDMTRLGKQPRVKITQYTNVRGLFLHHLEESHQRAINRLKEKDGLATRIAAAYPGKLRNGEKDWDKWVTGLKTVLTLTRGVKDVPLIYVIREDTGPAPENMPGFSFEAECIAKARLHGPDFEADAKQVHLIIKPLVIGELAEHLILPGYDKENGREDFKILLSHYDGDGKNTRRIHDAVNWHKSLSYNSEKKMPFETFYSHAQNMWNIFERNNEKQSEPAKIRWFLDNISNPNLDSAKAALSIQLQQDPDFQIWTFDKVAQYMQREITARIASDAARAKIAGVNTAQPSKAKGKPKRPEYDPNGLFIGSHSDEQWRALPKETQKAVHKARKLADKALPATKGSAPKKRSIQSLSKQLAAQAKTIAALQKTTATTGSPVEASHDVPSNDAGTAFGGRASKKTRITD